MSVNIPECSDGFTQLLRKKHRGFLKISAIYTILAWCAYNIVNVVDWAM